MIVHLTKKRFVIRQSFLPVNLDGCVFNNIAIGCFIVHIGWREIQIIWSITFSFDNFKMKILLTNIRC